MQFEFHKHRFAELQLLQTIHDVVISHSKYIARAKQTPCVYLNSGRRIGNLDNVF